MQSIISTLKQAFRKSIVILGMVTLLTLSGLSIFVEQPSLAAPISTEGQKLIQQEKLDQQSQEAAQRSEAAYQEQVEAEKDPDKVYEKNLKSYEESNPGDNLVQKTVQGAEKLVEKVTGKE